MYSNIILENWLYIPKKEIYDLSAFEQELTVCSKYDQEKKFQLYHHLDNDWFGIPPHHYSNINNITRSITDTRIKGELVDFRFISKFWPGQKELLDNFINEYENGKTGFVIKAKTGSGKSLMALAILAEIGRKALIVVPRSNLVDQWIEKIVEHTTIRLNEIGYINGNKVSFEDKKIVVGLVHSLALNRFGSDFRDNFGVVVFDEVHSTVPPETFSSVVTMFRPKIRIGMTATTKRKDGLHVIFEKHIGETFLEANVVKRMPATVLMQTFADSSGYIPPGMKKLNRRGMLLSKLAHNHKRNMLIAKYVLRTIKSDGRRVLVLSDRTWQLVKIKKLIDILAQKYNIDLQVSDSDYFVNTLTILDDKGLIKKKKAITPEYRARVAKNCKIILASYGMFGLGSDIPELSGLIYATPQSSAEQTQGRIERFIKDKRQPVVVDIVDTYYKDTLRWWNARKSWYKNNGIIVKKI